MKKKEHGNPKEKYYLMVTDTSKGQDNAEIKELSSKYLCEWGIVPHNFTYKLQPVNITQKFHNF